MILHCKPTCVALLCVGFVLDCFLAFAMLMLRIEWNSVCSNANFLLVLLYSQFRFLSAMWAAIDFWLQIVLLCVWKGTKQVRTNDCNILYKKDFTLRENRDKLLQVIVCESCRWQFRSNEKNVREETTNCNNQTNEWSFQGNINKYEQKREREKERESEPRCRDPSLGMSMCWRSR